MSEEIKQKPEEEINELQQTELVRKYIDKVINVDDAKNTISYGVSQMVERTLNSVFSTELGIVELHDMIFGKIANDLIDKVIEDFPEIKKRMEAQHLFSESTTIENIFYLAPTPLDENGQETGVEPYVIILEEHYRKEGEFNKVYLKMIVAQDILENNASACSFLKNTLDLINITVSNLESVYISAIYSSLTSDDIDPDDMLTSEDVEEEN